MQLEAVGNRCPQSPRPAPGAPPPIAYAYHHSTNNCVRLSAGVRCGHHLRQHSAIGAARMVDDSKSPLSRRVVESFADSVKAHVRKELAERDAEIACLTGADARTLGIST